MTRNPLSKGPFGEAPCIRTRFFRHLAFALIAISLSILLTLSSFASLPFAFATQQDGSDQEGNSAEPSLIIGSSNPVNKIVNAGIFAFDGYHEMDESGNLYGYGIEILELISKYSHLNFNLVGFDSSWSDMLGMLERGEIDVVTSASKTSEREAMFDYSLPIGRKNTVLSVAYDNDRFVGGSYGTYNGMVVGEIPGNAQNDIFAEFAAERGFDYSVIMFSDNNALVEALATGEVDAILTSDLRKRENEKDLEIIEEDSFYAIVRKGDTELLNEINYAIEQMDINEGDWQHTLFYEYYGPSYSNQFEFTQREQQYIEEVRSGQKHISATAFMDRRPYSYLNDGQLDGIMIDYFSVLMDMAGLPYELIVPKDLEEYEALIDGERVNIILDGVDSDFSTRSYFDDGFSTEQFMDTNVVQVTRTGFTGEPKTIAVSDSSTGSLDAFLASQEGVELIHYPTREAALQAVLDGNADCAYVYVYTAQEFINRDLTNSLTFSAVYGLDMQFEMRVSANTDHELVTILNKCIKQVPESTLNTIVSEYTSYTARDVSFTQYLLANPAILIALIIALFAVVIVIIAFILRARWNQRLIDTQEESNHKLKEQLSIVEALSRDYTNVFAVDEKRGMAKIVKLEGYVTEGLSRSSKEEHPYQPLLTTYIEDRVHPEDKEQLAEELSIDTVRQKLAEDDEYAGTYRILVGDETHNFQYTFIKVKDSESDEIAQSYFTEEDDGPEGSGESGSPAKGAHGAGAHARGAKKDSADRSFILVGFRNIDDAVRKEQEQKEVLSEALAQAQYANNAKTTFLNNMSHDIRTPMNAIIGFTALAGTHIDNTEQVQSYLGKIMTSSNHLLSLINDVLDMSRIESGKVKIENKETSLPEVMHDLRTIVQSDIKGKGLEFYIDMLGVTNEIVICDKLRLSQVLLNILSNAIKYTNPGDIVSMRIEQLGAPDASGAADYKFTIKDTGIGMSAQFLEHVFEPFEREETATVSGIQGTGLGLAITKNIVDMMDGTIEVASQEGEGSEFAVTLRFDVVEESEPFVPPEELHDLRALVVDDDMETCTSVSSMLVTIGMRPDWTTQSQEAIAHTKFAQEENDPYSAYIIDWIMPNMGGLELVRRIRQIIGDETPIIIATAYDWTDIEEEAKEAGVTAICSKPIFLSELRDILMRPYTEGGSDVGLAAGSAQDGIKKAFDDATERLKGTRILLAEDNEMSREIAKTILEDAEIIVDAVEDGSYALQKMKDNPAGTYDVILTDVQMPQMNGYETTKAIRALDDPEKASIPIIAVTANAFEEDREEAEEAGMTGYIPKPIEIEKLFEALEDILDS